MTDGSSNTAAFSEHVTGDFNNAVATEMADTFWPQTYPANADEAVRLCRDMDWRNLAFQRVSDVGALGLRLPLDDQLLALGPPNSRSCMFPPSRIMTVANSNHPGGVNLLLADGSIRFLKATVNVNAWRALGTRNGGEILSADSY